MSQHDLLEDEGAGYLISISDMMAGLLFIFIITLVAFIINLMGGIHLCIWVSKVSRDIHGKHEKETPYQVDCFYPYEIHN